MIIQLVQFNSQRVSFLLLLEDVSYYTVSFVVGHIFAAGVCPHHWHCPLSLWPLSANGLYQPIYYTTSLGLFELQGLCFFSQVCNRATLSLFPLAAWFCGINYGTLWVIAPLSLAINSHHSHSSNFHQSQSLLYITISIFDFHDDLIEIIWLTIVWQGSGPGLKMDNQGCSHGTSHDACDVMSWGHLGPNKAKYK